MNRWTPRTTATDGYFPSFSPDGRYLAYGEKIVSVAEPGAGAEWLIGQGGRPQWIGPSTFTYLTHDPRQQ